MRDLPGHIFAAHLSADQQERDMMTEKQARPDLEGLAPSVPDDQRGKTMTTIPADPDHEVVQAELVDDAPGREIELKPLEVLKRFRSIPVVSLDTREQVQERLLAQRLNAESVAELLSGQAVRAAKDMEGLPFECRDVHFMESTFDSGLGVYVAAHCADCNTGELFTMTTGAPDVVIQLAKLMEWGALPARLKVVRSNNPEPGRAPALHVEADVDPFPPVS